jgi:hypothetical protein
MLRPTPRRRSFFRKPRRGARRVAVLHERAATPDCGKWPPSRRVAAPQRAIRRCVDWPWNGQGRHHAPCLARFGAATRRRAKHQHALSIQEKGRPTLRRCGASMPCAARRLVVFTGGAAGNSLRSNIRLLVSLPGCAAQRQRQGVEYRPAARKAPSNRPAQPGSCNQPPVNL